MTTTITVSTAAELEDALRKATGGETILLEGGNYGELEMGKWTSVEAIYPATVTIASADPADPAVFTALNLRDVENFTVEGVTFDYTHKGEHLSYNAFVVSGGADVTIRNSSFEGDVVPTGLTEPTATGIALAVKGVTGCTVEGNTFQDFYKGAFVFESTDVVFAHNEMHSLRSDGLNVVSTQGILVEDNHFHDFAFAEGSKDHMDFIQFWTMNATIPTTDVVIRGNLLDVGDGSHTQSIFMRNEMVDTGRAGSEMYYQNVLIEDNVILNGHLHGITVGETDGLVIRNNTLLEAGADVFAEPRINVNSDSTGVAVTGNVSHAVPEARSGWTISDNLLVQFDDPAAPDYFTNFFVESSLQDGGIPVLRQDNLELDSSFGAAMTAEGGETRVGFSTFGSEADPLTRVFDAASTMSAQGFTDAAIGAMRFEWTFGDGTSATGPVVSRSFSGPGEHAVDLSVTLPAGEVLETGGVVALPNPTLLRLSEGDLLIDELGADVTLFDGSSSGIRLPSTGSVMDLKAAPLQRVDAAASLSMDVTVQAAGARAAGGEILNLVGTLWLGTREDDVSAVLQTESGGRIKLYAADVGVNDGRAHDISVRFDDATGRAELMVDGVLAAAAQSDEGIGGGHNRLTIGNPYGKTNFDGTITDLRLDVVDPFQAYDGPWTPDEAAAHVKPSAEQPVLIAEPLPQDAPAPAPAPAPTEVVEPAPAPADRPIFDLATVDPSTIDFKKTTELVEAGGVQAIRLNGDGGYAKLTGLGDPENDGAFTVRMSYQNDDPASASRLLWNHTTFGIEVEGETVRVYAKADGQKGMEKYVASHASLDDGGEHDIAVAIDSALDRIQIVVNGDVVLDDVGSADIALADDPGGRDWGWWVGTPWKQDFDGTVTALTIEDDAAFDDGMLLA